MSYTIRDRQARVNALLFSETPFKPLKIDGMDGPKTRAQTAAAMELRGVDRVHELFGQARLHRVQWHWSASKYAVTAFDLKHYNVVHDFEGNTYDGGARPEHQANYDWRRGVGVSHTKNANTGAIGECVVAMHGATGWPLNQGDFPLTWEGIDAMLRSSIDHHHNFDIPITPYSMLSHAEVEPTLGIAQSGKWDYMTLPDGTKIMDPVECGDFLRERMRNMMQNGTDKLVAA